MNDDANPLAEADELIEQYYAGKLTERADIIRALGHKWFRLNTLYKITVKKKAGQKSSVIRFRPNPAQRQRFLDLHYRDLILKARQLGFTTFEMIDMLDSCLFTPNFRGGCIAHSEKDAKQIYQEKIRFAYENIPPSWLAIFEEIGLDFPVPTNDRSDGYVFSNNSKLYVGVSFRGGTLDHLHVSEFGKICRKYPEKAEEIVSGAFEAVPVEGRITIESTAEGQAGRFYEYSQESENLQREGRPLTTLDFNFHFFPWWQADEYRLPVDGVVIPDAMKKYFKQLEATIGQKLDTEQKAWYVKKAAVLKGKMKQEYPSTPKEAFEQAIEGAYYADEMARIREEGRIRRIPYDSRVAVNAFMDLGRNDSTAIWFMQPAYETRRMIRYYENSGEPIQHYIKYMQSLGYVFDTIYMPHDADVIEYTRADNKSRADILRGAGFRVVVVDRVPDKMEAIQAVRDVLPFCEFDKENCDQGIKCLDHYHKEWDDKRGCWRDRPYHDWSSHGNDAFEQMARGFSSYQQQTESFEPEFG